MPPPYPTSAAFAAAAHAFVNKYPRERGAGLGPDRTNAGWEWRTTSDRVSAAYARKTMTGLILVPGRAGVSRATDDAVARP
ncbi:hypothetical protein CC85DRAFT_287201 [Cutaneotrichosporon oleaginosum]|uniref:Uncharacterized protein n=1 Tax=Cutaneotrichosporon oleaginosum TaxID=879819 RepID=A0A0J0XHU0_9TREE|nr:uncharacterized protein CC85DRAFT_287201 [Cutaneotrichosporon oleaginosum]KLT40690.1 hypothetical protein CC85DRAFT_287201 [Cutaneotrichosporon oleaginosum]TXT14261.1 hypothetical protein COLE_00454 [Cutaneotrichosporon oleaginosum]